MKIKNGDMVQMLNAYKGFEGKRLPNKIAYAIIKNTMSLSSEYEVYSKLLTGIANKYIDDNKVKLTDSGEVEKFENGLPIVKDEYVAEFTTEIEELLMQEVEVQIKYVEEEDFNYDDSKYDVLSVSELFTLIDIMVEKK